jgi:hypothetical protein
MLTFQPKITFGDVRASCVRDVLVYYCRNHKCSHHITISADRWPDHVRLSDIEPDFVAPPAANVARRCGRSFRRPAWAPMDTRRSSMPIWQAKEDGRVDSD